MTTSQTDISVLHDVHQSLQLVSEFLALATCALQEDNRATARTLVQMAGHAAASARGAVASERATPSSRNLRRMRSVRWAGDCPTR